MIRSRLAPPKPARNPRGGANSRPSGALALTLARAVQRRDERLSSFYPGRPLILGHRGAMARAPENTIGAFRAAIDDGADGVELDTQLSKDHVAIVLHDDLLDRTTSGRGWPIDVDAEALARLDAGSWFGAAWRDERVPTLDQALACLPDGKVCNVEIKGPTPNRAPLEARVVDVVRAHARRLHIVVSSFDVLQLFAVKRRAPEIPLGLLMDPDAPWPLRTPWTALVLRPDALHPPSSMVDAAFVAAAHRAGMRVHVWRVRDDDDARRLIDCGVDGLIVDDPGAVSRFLSTRP